MPSVELLAPAGNWDCLRAAVENGADAIYFGVEAFNARARAANFQKEELPAIAQYLHARGVKSYLTLNVLIFSDELPAASDLLLAASAAGIDAVLVQDLGLAHLAQRLVPDFPVHASTQMTVTSPRAMAFLETWGVSRFVLPREFSVEEIKRVHAAATAEIEIFVHGALCVAYSGQCLTSEALGGRSANRGQCAQACRQPYELIVDGEKRDLDGRNYLLSPQDLAGIELIPRLIEAGVSCLKIEGRLKTPEYVANITSQYRKALDQALAGGNVALSGSDWQDLAQSFSRGLTPGFLDGVNHQKLVPARYPKSRGLAAGMVTEITPPWVRLAGVDVPLKPGDGIVFDNGDPERDEPGGPLYEVRKNGQQVEIALAHGFPFKRVTVGDRMWKTSDPVLNERLRRSFAGDARTVPVDLVVTGTSGARLTVHARCGSSEVLLDSAEILSAGAAKPLDRDVLVQKLGKLGDTRYHLRDLTVSLTGDLMLPVSALNRLRRALVEKLDSVRGRPPVRRAFEAALETERAGLGSVAGNSTADKPQLRVFCRSEAQIRAACEAGVSRVYADFEDPRGFRESVAVARKAGVPIFLATPRIEKPGEEGFFRKLAGYKPDGVLVRNLGGLFYFREHHRDFILTGDFSLNCANDLTARRLLEMGLESIVPSYDLNAQQLQGMLDRVPGGHFEIVLQQYMPMFHMEHCVFAALLSTGRDYKDCGRPCERHDVSLRDHTGREHPVKADVGCRNTVFNGQAQSGALYLDRFLEAGVRAFRLEFLSEDAARTSELIAVYGGLLEGAKAPRAVWSTLRATQRLGVTKGTLDL